MACHFEGTTMNDKDRVDRLDKAMVEEILGLSDDEVATFVGKTDMEASRQGLDRAKATVGRLRLARAKTGVALHAASAKTSRGDGRTDGRRLQTLRSEDPGLDRKMTLAARSGKANAEADAATLDEDLGELDAWEAEDQDRS
jgi:hypothetical protein